MQGPVCCKGNFQRHEGQLDTKVSLKVSACCVCPLSLYLELLKCLLSSHSIESGKSFSSKTFFVTSHFAVFPSMSVLWKREISQGFELREKQQEYS